MLNQFLNSLSIDDLADFFYQQSDHFRKLNKKQNDTDFECFDLHLVGEFIFELESVPVYFARVHNDVNQSKTAQFKIAKTLLKNNQQYSAGFFIFVDKNAQLRLSFLSEEYSKNKFGFKRSTFVVDTKSQLNAVFMNSLQKREHFLSVEAMKLAFSEVELSDVFYNSFQPEFQILVDNIQVENIQSDEILSPEAKEEFALLFVIRVIFIGFVQKRLWINNDPHFLKKYFEEYDLSPRKDNYNFYNDWLKPLFFDALNKSPKSKTADLFQSISTEFQKALIEAPYLNGGLFSQKPLDIQNVTFADETVKRFFNFIFGFNFTLEESINYDDIDISLNPEFLGIIFEKINNKKNGAIYTPRTEVDLMCRLSLIKWLEQQLPLNSTDFCYQLFYDSESLTNKNRLLLTLSSGKLKSIKICDPAVGSGAFPVGLLNVLIEIHKIINKKLNKNTDNYFELKKHIIANNLYGVELEEKSVWITQLRLWLSLFLDAPENLRHSEEPLLPSLDFKIYQGDSLVQKIGTRLFPLGVFGSATSQIDFLFIEELSKLKEDYFYNRLKDKSLIQNKMTEFHSNLIEKELKQLHKKLKQFSDIGHQTQDNLIEATPTRKISKAEQKKIDAEREYLQSEIEELQNQLLSLHSHNQFIWDIHFMEIFDSQGGFDLVIGNPPYVRQEEFAGKYKDSLIDMMSFEYPNLKIDQKSDLYIYFYLKGFKLLNPKGILTYICSNSWLDVNYGVALQSVFLNQGIIDCIIDNRSKRSFKSADINTIISIIKRKHIDDLTKPMAKFIAFKRPFEEVIHYENLKAIHELKADDQTTRGELMIPNRDDLIALLDLSGQQLEMSMAYFLVAQNNVALRQVSYDFALKNMMLGIKMMNHILSQMQYKIQTTEIISTADYRIYAIDHQTLYEMGCEQEENSNLPKYIGEKWGGKFLKAPDIFFTILEKGKNKLVKLGELADVRFGIKTGANEFFYLNNEQIQEWQIEEKFLQPVIKSPRECKSITIDPNKLQFQVFLCDKSKEDLKDTNALKYIEWGEKQGFHEKPTCIVRQKWWDLGNRFYSNFFCSQIFRERFVFFSNNNLLVDCVLNEGFSDDSNMPLFLNSTSALLLIETTGRSGLLGALKIQISDFRNILVLKPEFLDFSNFNHEAFFTREIKDIFTECGIDPKSKTPISEQIPNPLPDRAELDQIVFDALNLSSEERIEVYRSVCQLVFNRVNKAKSV